jgi:hypothetical protein
MDITTSTPSVKSQATLAVLRVAIAKTLDKKQRLGQYAVVWQDGRPVLTGPDAPGGPARPVGDMGRAE